MVTLTAGNGAIDYGNSFGFYIELEGPAESITPTELVFGDSSSFGIWDRITGTGFVDSNGNGRPESGTVQTLEVWRGPDLLFTLSGFNMAWADFDATYIAGGTFPVSFLAGDDVIHGSPEDDRFFGNDGDDVINGNGGDDQLEGEDGDDELFGGPGDDRLLGGEGDDDYHGGAGDDFLNTELSDSYRVDGGEGVDGWRGVFSSSSDGIIFSGTAAAGNDGLSLDGDRFVRRVEGHTLVFGAGNDVFSDYKLVGDDHVSMGDGDDRVHVSIGVDQAIGNGFGSNEDDRLFVDYSAAAAGLNSDLSAHFDGSLVHLVWEGPGFFGSATRSVASTGFDRVEIVGSDFADRLVGTDGSDRLFGGRGNDVLTPQLGDDLLDGGNGNDTLSLRFTSFSNFLGISLPPFLVSGANIDLMLAGAQALPDYNAFTGFGFEQLPLGTVTLRRIENVEGTGRGDQLRGDELANRLAGLAGDDFLNGRGGNDRLEGGEGDDRMMGGLGDNRFDGGEGSDTVSYAWAGSAVTVDLRLAGFQATGAGGADRFILVENLVGTAADDRLTGNFAANRLDGGAGADTMTGGDGNDTYVLDQAGDQIVESGTGKDRVVSPFSYTLGAVLEHLTLSGGDAVDGTGNGSANSMAGNDADNGLAGLAGDDRLYGMGGDDELAGGADDDNLTGGEGEDRLTGGGGQDGYYFDAALDEATNVDEITDFSPVYDTIFLDVAVFIGYGEPGTLAPDAFRLGTAAADGDDRILYDAATGEIRFDPDGDGAEAAILFATVDAGTALTHADFVGYI